MHKVIVHFHVSIPLELEEKKKLDGDSRAPRSDLVDEAAQSLARYTRIKAKNDREKAIDEEEINRMVLENGAEVTWEVETRKAPSPSGHDGVETDKEYTW